MLCLANVGFVQCFPFGSRSLWHAVFVSNSCFVLFASPSSGFVQCFSLPLSLHLFVFLCFIEFFSRVMRVLPNKLRFVQCFFPGLPSNLHTYFLLVLFSFYFVFCVLSLANLIFLRFP